MYEILIDWDSITKIENPKPTEFENVKVWVTKGIEYSVAENAKIKDLEYISRLELRL